MRVQATKTENTPFPAYGAQIVQPSVVNMAESGVNVFLANKHYEVAPVLSPAEHNTNHYCMWVSEKTWNSLSFEQQGWVHAAAEEVSKKEPTLAMQLEKDFAEKLKKLGVKVIENVDKRGFMKAATPI